MDKSTQDNLNKNQQPELVNEQPDQGPDNGQVMTVGSMNKSGKKKKIIALGLAVALLLIASGAYYWFSMKDPAPAPAVSQTDSSQPTPKKLKANKVYFFKKNTTSKVSLLEVNAGKLDGSNIIANFDTPTDPEVNASLPRQSKFGNNRYVFRYGLDIWSGKFDGQAPQIIYTLESKFQDFTGLVLSSDEKEVYVSLSDEASSDPTAKKSSIIAINPDTRAVKTLYKSDGSSGFGTMVFSGYNNQTELYVRTTCWFCDGSSDSNTSFTIDTSNGQRTETSPYDKLTTPDAPGSPAYYAGPPVTFWLRDNSTKQDTSLGALGEKKLDEYNYPAYSPSSLYLGNSGSWFISLTNGVYEVLDGQTKQTHALPNKYNVDQIGYADSSMAIVMATDVDYKNSHIYLNKKTLEPEELAVGGVEEIAFLGVSTKTE
jgi:hypothetical protein